MVKIGNTYINLEAVEAVAPVLRAHGYEFFLVSGHRIVVECVTEEELTESFSREGYLPLPDIEDSTASLSSCFTADELKELAEVWAEGYRYIGKDANGKVYAYSKEPIRGAASWLNDDAVSDVARLSSGDYSALFFEDIAPLHIGVIMEELGK